MILLTETSLNPDISSGELGMDNYNIYRKDRDSTITGKQRNGGVLIAVNKKYKSQQLIIFYNDSEEIWVSISLCKNIKIPPSSCSDTYKKHCETVERASSLYSDHSLFVAGDYNLPNLKWSNDNLGTLIDGYSSVAESVIETFPY